MNDYEMFKLRTHIYFIVLIYYYILQSSQMNDYEMFNLAAILYL